MNDGYRDPFYEEEPPRDGDFEYELKRDEELMIDYEDLNGIESGVWSIYHLLRGENCDREKVMWQHYFCLALRLEYNHRTEAEVSRRVEHLATVADLMLAAAKKRGRL